MATRRRYSIVKAEDSKPIAEVFDLAYTIPSAER